MRRLAVLLSAGLVASAGLAAAEVMDDPDLRVVREAVGSQEAAPPRKHTVSAQEESRSPNQADRRHRSRDTQKQVTVRFRDDTDESASISIALDLDDGEESLARWIDAMSGSQVLSVEWEDGELAIRVD